MDDATSITRPGSRVLGFFSNPWIGIVGGLSGIIGLPLAVYFFFAQIQQPGVRYYIRPVRSVLAQAGSSSDVTILYKGQPTGESVTAALVALWNAGKKPVLQGDVLSRLELRVQPGHRILEAKVVKTTRQVVGLKVDQGKVAEGVVGIDFTIFEHNDGGVIQLIYEGDSTTQITASGAVVGQSELLPVVFAGKLRTLDEQYRSIRRSDFWINLTLALLPLILAAAVGIFGKRMFETLRGERMRLVFLVSLLAESAAGFFILYHDHVPVLPFDFG